MTIVEALKALIKTMTGVDATGETIEELIRELNENYTPGEGGGGSTPSSNEYLITGEFNAGTWEASNFEHDGASVHSADVLSAFTAGKQVRMYLFGETVSINLYMTQYSADGDGVFVFCADGFVPNLEHVVCVLGNFSGTAQLVHFPTVPIFNSSEDVGEILTVTANGLDWALPQ